MAEAIVEVTQYNLCPEIAQSQEWQTKGEVIQFDGFMKLYIEGKDEEENLQPNTPKYTNWIFPTIEILKEPEKQTQNKDRYRKDALVIETTLKSFGIDGKVAQIAIGPTVVRYSLKDS